MKKLILALIFTAPVMATSFAGDYKPSQGINEKQALILAQVVKMNGYTCDSINAASRSVWSNGKFKLICNNWNYVYSIDDKGGRVVVSVE